MRLTPVASIAAAGMVALLAASCGSSTNPASGASTSSTSGGAASTAGNSHGVPGLTANTVTIGITAGFSGPFATNIKEQMGGLLAWQKQVNGSGGVYGRKVVFKEYDDKDTTDGAVAACKQILADDDVFFNFTIEGSGAHLTLGNCLNQAGFTNFLWQTSDKLGGNWKHTYGFFAGNTRAGQVTAKYIASKIKAGAKVAVAYEDSPIYVNTGTAMKAQLQAEGVDIVDTESLDPAGTTYLPQLEHMKAAGATVVALSTIEIEATMLKEAKSIGFNPLWIGTGYVYDFLPQASPGVYTGVMGLSLSETTDDPGYAAYVKLASGFGIKCQTGCAQQFIFYGEGKVIQAALQAAGRNPTRQTLAAGIKTIHNFPTSASAPISFTTNNYGTDVMFPAICCSASNTWKSDGAPSDTF